MKARYHATGNYLEELPEYAPLRELFDQNGLTEDGLRKGKEYLATLRTIPCHPSCVGKWSDGQEVEEGVDYNIQYVYFKDWKEYAYDDPQEEWETMGYEYVLKAFPLPVKSEDQNSIWKEAAEKLALTFFGDEPVGSQGYYAALLTYEGEMEVLKQYFTLTKK